MLTTNENDFAIQQERQIEPEVSVVIPAYNAAAFIARAIDSALSQTLKNIEVLVVDDASKDNTSDIVRSFDDPRVRLLINQQNLGAAGARNRALQEARGEWVAVLDADDWYAPQRLQRLLQVARAHEADMVADDMQLIVDGQDTPWSTWMRESGVLWNEPRHIESHYLIDTNVLGQQTLKIGLSKPIFSRKLLSQYEIQYDPFVKVSQDFWLDFDCLLNGARFILVPEPYYYYRAHGASLVHTVDLTDYLSRECQKALNYLNDRSFREKHPRVAKALSNKYKRDLKMQRYYTVVTAIRKRDWLTAIAQILRTPYVLLQFLSRMKGIFSRRYNYYIKKDKMTFEVSLYN
jgi:succinoglycan biosynthesis protein ExoO